MSQGPFGLGRGTLGPAPACAVIVNVAPISVSASATISARLILVFMFIVLAFAVYSTAEPAIKSGFSNVSLRHICVVGPLGTKPNGVGAALFAVTPPDVGLLYDHPWKTPKRTAEVARWHLYEVEF